MEPDLVWRFLRNAHLQGKYNGDYAFITVDMSEEVIRSSKFVTLLNGTLSIASLQAEPHRQTAFGEYREKLLKAIHLSFQEENLKYLPKVKSHHKN